MSKNTKGIKPHEFKKGQSGNPGGRPSLPPELKAIKEVSDQELRRIISKYFRMTHDEIALIKDSMNIPMIDKIMARTMIHASNKGDISKILPLFDRLCGKVPIMQADGGGQEPYVIKRFNGETIEIGIKRRDEEDE